jgi:hypothetical protein
VNLGNYEGYHLGFPVRFRPGRNPGPVLQAMTEQLAILPLFDVAVFESTTGGRVDFVLLRADWATGRISVPAGLEEFRPVAGGAPSQFLLLRRDGGTSAGSALPGRVDPGHPAEVRGADHGSGP